MKIFTDSKSIQTYRCRDLRQRRCGSEVDDRQKRVPGFNQQALTQLSVAVVGAGGLGGEFVRGAVKKGVGELILYDGDQVESSNLNRQFFIPRDIDKNKAVCLARNAARTGFMGTRLTAVPYFFQAAVDYKLAPPSQIIFCGVDNDETRIFVARYYLDIPVLFAAVSRDAGHGTVLVQEPRNACFACMQPQALEADTRVDRHEGACPGDPAIIDVVGLISMLALYALDSLVMDRPRRWNFKQIALHGNFPDVNTTIERQPDCPVCASKNNNKNQK